MITKEQADRIRTLSDKVSIAYARYDKTHYTEVEAKQKYWDMCEAADKALSGYLDSLTEE